jgi:hypothetical protein
MRRAKTQKWYDARDQYFFYTALALVALIVVVNIAANLAGN